jgi:hypothetical protein
VALLAAPLEGLLEGLLEALPQGAPFVAHPLAVARRLATKAEAHRPHPVPPPAFAVPD